MNSRALTALIFMLVGLLAVVILVGLAQRILDVTGVAVALCSVLTGVVGGSLLRSKQHPPPNSGPDEEKS